MVLAMKQSEPTERRFNVDLPAGEYDELKRRSDEEGIPMTRHVRRLVRQDAQAHPAPVDLVAPRAGEKEAA